MKVYLDPKDPLKMRFTRQKHHKRNELTREISLPYKKCTSLKKANKSSKPVKIKTLNDNFNSKIHAKYLQDIRKRHAH